MCGKGFGAVEPLFGDELSERIVGRGHIIAVGVDHLLEPARAALVIIRYKACATDFDCFEIAVGVVRNGISLSVAVVSIDGIGEIAVVFGRADGRLFCGRRVGEHIGVAENVLSAVFSVIFDFGFKIKK